MDGESLAFWAKHDSESPESVARSRQGRLHGGAENKYDRRLVRKYKCRYARLAKLNQAGLGGLVNVSAEPLAAERGKRILR
jgi:hypothetical protein